MAETFVLRLDEIQPSQLYLNEAKVAAVQAGTGSLEPLPVRRLGGQVVLTDGHTRGFVAWQAGQRQIEVYWDGDELDWEAYELCVGWCRAEGIHTVADLAHRIVPPEAYEVVWLERCARMQRRLRVARVDKQRQS